MITVKNERFPLGVTGKLEAYEGKYVLIRFKTDGGWSKAHRYLKTEIVRVA